MELPVQIGKEIHIIRIGVVYDCVNDIHAGIGDGAARQRRAAVCVIGIIRITRKAVIQQIFCIIISYVTLQACAAVQPVDQHRGDILRTAFGERLLLHDRTKRDKFVKRHIILPAIVQHIV